MSVLTVEKEWRGSTLKLRCSIMRSSDNYVEMTTETIDFDGLAQVVGKLQCTSESDQHLQLCIGLKKSEAAKNFIISAKIKYKDFDKEFPCAEEWIEIKVNNKIPKEGWVANSSLKVYLYNIAVNITVDATMNAVPIVNNLLYDDDKFTDFQLQAADGTVAVHKAILSVHGDMFKAMLSGKWKETEKGIININGVTLQTLQNLKKYMYFGSLPDEGIESLLQLAAFYLMEKLETDCIKKLIESLKPEKLDDLIDFALQNNITKLVRALTLAIIPDDIVNNINKLDLNKQKSDEKKDLSSHVYI